MIKQEISELEVWLRKKPTSSLYDLNLIVYLYISLATLFKATPQKISAKVAEADVADINFLGLKLPSNVAISGIVHFEGDSDE